MEYKNQTDRFISIFSNLSLKRKVIRLAKRLRLSDTVCLKISPVIREKIERAANLKELTMSELARAYIEEGLARDGVTC